MSDSDPISMNEDQPELQPPQKMSERETYNLDQNIPPENDIRV